jgi:hypothetical protein
MKFLFLLGIIYLNSKDITLPKKTPINQEIIYPLAISFGSMCCGTPSDDFLKYFIMNYNKKNKTRMNAYKTGGCGREGEFVIFIDPNKMKASTQKKMTVQLEKTVAFQNKKNKNTNSSSGTLELLKNIKASQYAHCSVKIKKWL